VTALETRQEILRRLKEDLIGPSAEDEKLEISRPLDTYLSGILWPLESKHDAEEDDGAALDEDEESSNGQVSVFGQMKPSTMD
jgi:hypothetical protein